MKEFEFLQNKLNGKWIISAPRRSKRTNVGKESTPICPFCPGQEIAEEELYQVGEGSEWKIRVVKNKFPFAPNHEIIVHSPDHHKNWDELPFSANELILRTYRQRFNFHKQKGSVYIFHNSGPVAGASLAHPHTQLVVVPNNVKLDITPLDQNIYKSTVEKDVLQTEQFLVFCPATSEWPDEIWIAPKQNGGGFGMIKDPEIADLSFVLSQLVQIFDLRHGHEFPYNFYISPTKNWYIRIIPRIKLIGGFELGTNIMVNTQDPGGTLKFILEHFWKPDKDKISSEHKADYLKSV